LQALDVVTTWEAADGATALALYAEHAPTVVFLDVNMPSMPGADTLQQLLQLDPEVSVIIVTSDSGHQTVRRFLELGAIGYVLKQRPPEEFRKALHELLAPFAEPAE
jgi:DNA-binding NarL/FixJ family response regulator